MNAYFGNIVNNESRIFHGRAYLDLVCVFQWLVVLLVLLVMNALWMCRRRSRRRIHRISSIRDAQREVYTNEER